RWDLRERKDLEKLIAALDEEIGAPPPSGGPVDAPGAHGRGSGDSDRSALVQMRALAAQALASEGSSCESLIAVAEIGDSLDLSTQVPVRRRIDLVEVPFYYYDVMHNPVGVGDESAWNLAPDARTAADTSLVDPLPSTFWSRPEDIASRDLYEPFGPILKVGSEPCIYDEPKTSYGTTPGFSMKCSDREIKVKFGSTESSKRDTEVAVTRLYGALGYNVEANDYAPEIRVRSDRAILPALDSPKDPGITMTGLGFIPVGRIRIQTAEDPFRYIRSAVTKDGTMLTTEQLAQRLIRPDILQRSPRASRKHPRGTQASHYREDAAAFEQELDTLIMVEGNVQARGIGGRNVGPWAWDALDHPKRRELRGAAMLSAWTNHFDVRWDNNRLKLVDGDGGTSIRHFISD